MAEQSDVIITGEVISSAASWNIERTRIYTTHQIQIDHIYKGFVDDAIVSIRTIGGEVDDLFQFMTHTVELHPGQFGYAFLRKIPDSNVYELYHTESFYEVSYETEGNLIIDGEVLRPVQFDRAIISSTKQRPQTFAENVRYRTSGLGLTEYSCSNTSEGAVTLELKFDNVTISSDLSFLEFDIFAKSSMPGIQFGKGNIFLNYSTEFGTSVVQNGTADISKSEVIQDTVYALSYSDVGQQNLALNIDLSDPYSNNLHVFSSGYDTLLHVKLAITSIANVGDISFDDLTIASNMKYWCRNQYVDFDEVIYDGPIGAIQSQPGNEIGITYTFGNELINNNNYIFEVFAAATAESKFSDAFIYIDYNELGFQPNIASELSFIPGDLLLEGGNLYETFPFDFDENTLQFIIFSGGAPDPNQLTILSTTPKKVGTFTFPISSCDQEKEIKFNSETEVSDHTHYTGVMPVPYELYDPVKADDDLSGKICDCEDPEITMLSDLSINAGNGEVLVITGTDFGTYSFTDSKVMFRNGDDGGSSWMTAPRSSITENGIIQWSDDEIKVRVPSVGANSLITKPAASGFVRVENACGEDNSEDELNIPFAITNVKSSSTSGEPVKIGLSNLNENGICFTYGNLEGNDVPAWVKIEFANAISEWCNKTEIPLSVKQEEVEINGAAFNDGINSVTIENDLEVHAGAAVLFAGRTDGDGCNNGRVMTDIDIVISPSLIGSMPSSADEIDMRNKLKHEIGHVQMINHSVDLDAGSVPFQPIVYWSHTATAQGGQFVSIKPVDEEGANLIYQTSSDIVNTNCGGTPIEPSDNCNLICEDPNNTTIYQHESSKIEIYPNPISGTRLNLKVNGAELERDAQASISNIAGEVFPIYRRGINTFEMVTKPSPGLYVLKIYQYDATIVKKVIIQ